MSKLIIIRGPSGAGKSTVARELCKRSVHPTLLVSEDSVRKMFSDHHKPGHKAGLDLAVKIVKFGLNNDYDVVFEGILDINVIDLSPLLSQKECYLFYLNISLDETINRHAQRSKSRRFGPEALRRWWKYASPTNHPTEIFINESSSKVKTVNTIAKVANIKLNKV